MKSKTFKEYIQPVVVLVAICLVITFALAYVNSITSPIIAENSAKAADASEPSCCLQLPALKNTKASFWWRFLTKYLLQNVTLQKV